MPRGCWYLYWATCCTACAVYTPDLAQRTTTGTADAGSGEAGQGGLGGGGGGAGDDSSVARNDSGDAGSGDAFVADAGTDEGPSVDAFLEAATADGRWDGLADAPSDVADAGCQASQCILRAALVHRYSFNGMGSVAIDSVGKANGTVVNAQLGGTGLLVLAGGGADQYVDLPNGIVKSLANATFEVWATWNGGMGWQRLFDFGSSTAMEGTQSAAATTFYLTPQGGGPRVMLAAFKRQDQMAVDETRALSGQGMPANTSVHLAVVVDATNGLMTLYRDGATEGSATFRDSLSLLSDVNNWLGRSQYTGNDSFGGTLDEFRIYNVALSQSDIRASYAAGPNPPFLN
jgi:hypothetical protein